MEPKWTVPDTSTIPEHCLGWECLHMPGSKTETFPGLCLLSVQRILGNSFNMQVRFKSVFFFKTDRFQRSQFIPWNATVVCMQVLHGGVSRVLLHMYVFKSLSRHHYAFVWISETEVVFHIKLDPESPSTSNRTMQHLAFWNSRCSWEGPSRRNFGLANRT